ncbi:Y-family DNA polymerase [Pedobacter jeongneungensis]|uniref:Y-family DNA polymerase n=1 Tax=Pedobacter jeongneungensis TaxID=947309 RepID=UPI000468400A|nr:DNA polymerase Y family protein [Pedobacter jeongneungensis]
MERRFAYIWFCHLTTDQLAIRKPELKGIPFVLAAPERGRMVIRAVSPAANAAGIVVGMVLADARALMPDLKMFDQQPGKEERLLRALAAWFLRYTPVAAIDLPDGLILDITGCAHLWGGEQNYLEDILARLSAAGYHLRAAITDTVGMSWAVARYGTGRVIIERGAQREILKAMPPAGLRLAPEILDRLSKLGFYRIGSFIDMPRAVLRRRFGVSIAERLDQALGLVTETITPVQPVVPFDERLPCLEPIRTANGIQIAIRNLLEQICLRLLRENKGLRKSVLTYYRVDGVVQKIEIGTNQAVRNMEHLFKLFELKISTIRPGLGIELFVLEAPIVEALSRQQETLWTAAHQEDTAVANLLDRVAGRVGAGAVHRYLPDEHHWPERSLKQAASLDQQPDIPWPEDQPRPVSLLPKPEPIQVTSPVPDYPPMLFIYKGKVHKIRRADGPERIEQEWWIDNGLQRDYYCVEDESGARYWVFRSGHYDSGATQWYLHGFFA